MRIDVFSDNVCPWCFIGKRHLESALRDTGLDGTQVYWHAFQLNPDMPAAGRDRKQYLKEKFGSSDSIENLQTRMAEAGRAAGIEFQFDKITRSPNTFNSHRLVQLAQDQQLADVMVETLFHGYFLEGLDIGDDKTLVLLAQRAGVAGDIAGFLASGDQRTRVLEDLRTARELGIEGVPFFIFNSRYTLSGAQPVRIFTQALYAARDKSRMAS